MIPLLDREGPQTEKDTVPTCEGVDYQGIGWLDGCLREYGTPAGEVLLIIQSQVALLATDVSVV
jgi:hypothetical protein